MFQIKLLLSNVLLWLSLLPATIRYVLAFCFPQRAQRRVLKSILAVAHISEEAFACTPITTYDNYAEQIASLRRDGTNPSYREPVVRLCPTSGTSGRNKLIPYTESLKEAFRNGLYPWMFFLYLRFPRLFFSRQYWSLTPTTDPKSEWGESRIPIGFEDDREYVGLIQRTVLNTVWVDTQAIVAECPDIDSFLSQLAHRLSTEKALGLLSVWSPSLVSLLTKHHAVVLPKRLVLSSWAHSYSKEGAVRVAKNIGADLQPKGLLSTEACVTVPVGLNMFFLSYNSHYFEFRDIERNTLETATSLIPGREYEVIVTTQSGFIRYATGDIVRVTRHIFGRPSCTFVGRPGVIDLFGEKLDEHTVEQVVTTLLGDAELETPFWFLSPVNNTDGSVSYTLFTTSKRAYRDLSKQLDTLLRASYHYNYCRELGQLAEARVFVITDKGPEARFIEVASHESGARYGDVKIPHISRTFDWHQHFSGHFV